MKQYARNLRKKQTDAENKLWYFFRDRRFLGLKFRRQHVIGKYVVDFCCVERKLIIELDGGHHLKQLKKDSFRTKQLSKEGYSVIRFWDDDVLVRTQDVLNSIFRALTRTSSRPLPKGEGKSSKKDKG